MQWGNITHGAQVHAKPSNTQDTGKKPSTF